MDENIEDLVKVTTRGSLILLLGQVSSTLVLAFGMILVARFLGDVAYGSFNKAQSVVQIAFLLMNLGIQNAMIKYIAQYKHEGKSGYIKVMIEAGAMLNLLVSIILTIAVYTLSGFIADNIYHDPEQEILIQYLSMSIIGQAFLTYAQGITIGYERMELRSILQLCYSLFKSVLSPVLVYIGLGTLGAILGHTAPIILTGVVGIFFIYILYRGEKDSTRPITHLEAMKLMLSYGFPLYLSILLNGILPHLYVTLLGIWASDAQTGNYSAVLNFSVLLSFVTLPISTTIFPLFSKLENNRKQLDFLYRNAVKYSTLFGYPIIFTIMSLSEPIISIIYGNKFVYAPQYLRLYMLTFIFMGIGSVCNSPLLNSQRRTDLVFISTLARFIVALPLSFYTISNFGVVGLLFTYFLGTAINTTVDYYNIRRIFYFKINNSFLIKIFLLSIISYVSVYSIVNTIILDPWIELILGGSFSVCIYFVGLIGLKALTRQDFEYLLNLSSSFGPFSSIIKCFVELLIKYS